MYIYTYSSQPHPPPARIEKVTLVFQNMFMFGITSNHSVGHFPYFLSISTAKHGSNGSEVVLCLTAAVCIKKVLYI